MNRKLLTLSAAIVLAGSALAQLTWNPQPSADPLPLGVTVGFEEKYLTGSGVNGDKLAWGMPDMTNPDKLGETVRIGLTYNPEFGYGIGLLTGLYYEWTPTSYNKQLGGDVKQKVQSNAHELSLPIRFQLRYELMDDLSVFVYTGPSLDLGINYSQKTSLYDNGTLQGTYTDHVYSGRWKRTVKATDAGLVTTAAALGGTESGHGKSEDLKTLKRFHAYWGFGLGVQWKMLRFSYSADWGINNISNVSSSTDLTLHLNRPVNISLSYMFNVQ